MRRPVQATPLLPGPMATPLPHNLATHHRPTFYFDWFAKQILLQASDGHPCTSVPRCYLVLGYARVVDHIQVLGFNAFI